MVVFLSSIFTTESCVRLYSSLFVLHSYTLTRPYLSSLPKVTIGDRTALIGGFCTEDRTIYSPTKCPTLVPINDSITELWRSVTAVNTRPDLFIPMTHQLMPQDRATCEMIAAHPDLASITPVILGGHEHEGWLWCDCGCYTWSRQVTRTVQGVSRSFWKVAYREGRSECGPFRVHRHMVGCGWQDGI